MLQLKKLIKADIIKLKFTQIDMDASYIFLY